MKNSTRIVLAGLVLSSITVVAIFAWLRPVEALPAPAVPPEYHIIYLAPERQEMQAAEDTPGSFESLQAEGFQIVSNFPSLKTKVEKHRPDAIVLHKNQISKTDQKWIAQQYQKGIIIVGINVKMREIANLVGDPTIMNANWTEDWYKKPFYSYAGKKAATDTFSVQESSKTGLFAGAMTNGTNNFEANVKPFVSTLKLSIQSLRQQ